MLAKEVSFSASTLGTVEEINVRDLSGNTLSDIHPYKSSRNRMNRRHSPTASHIGITPWISSEKSLQSVNSNHDRITVYLWPLNQRSLVVLPLMKIHGLWCSIFNYLRVFVSSEWFSNINSIPVFPYQQSYWTDLIVGDLTIKINSDSIMTIQWVHWFSIQHHLAF